MGRAEREAAALERLHGSVGKWKGKKNSWRYACALKSALRIWCCSVAAHSGMQGLVRPAQGVKLSAERRSQTISAVTNTAVLHAHGMNGGQMPTCLDTPFAVSVQAGHAPS